MERHVFIEGISERRDTEKLPQGSEVDLEESPFDRAPLVIGCSGSGRHRNRLSMHLGGKLELPLRLGAILWRCHEVL
jgi:hypothetical protein